ncbi:MAG: hypothetical protein ACLTJG_12705 [[Clostridium] innocuum]
MDRGLVWGSSRYTYLLKLYKEKDLFVTLYTILWITVFCRLLVKAEYC